MKSTNARLSKSWLGIALGVHAFIILHFFNVKLLLSPSEWTIKNLSSIYGYPYSNGSDFRKILAEKPLCSNTLFRWYYQNHHAFPPPGEWVTRSRNVTSAALQVLAPDPCTFSWSIAPATSFLNCTNQKVSKKVSTTPFALKPEICSFKWNSLPAKLLEACFKQKGIRSMLMVGDSQGARYSWGMMALLNRTFHKCEILKIEDTGGKKTADLRYFSNGSPTLLSNMVPDERLCILCVSYHVLCTTKYSKTNPFRFEFIGMHHLSRFVMQVDLGDKYQNGTAKMSSFQEFLFRYHLQGPQKPDLIVVPPPVNHAKLKTVAQPGEFLRQVRSMKSLIETWMPNNARVVWLPGMAENENARGKGKYVNKTWGGKLASEIILDLNQILYEEMEPAFLSEKGRYFGFFDLFKASEGHDGWSLDGIHMKAFWYDLIMTYVMETFCAQ